MTRFSTFVCLAVLALGATHCGVPEVGTMYAAGIATAETPERRRIVGPGEYVELDLIGSDARILAYLDSDLAEASARDYGGGAGSTEKDPLIAISMTTGGQSIDYTAVAESAEVSVKVDAEGKRTINITTELESERGEWRYLHATVAEQPSENAEREYWVEYEFN